MDRARLIALAALYGAILIDEETAGPTGAVDIDKLIGMSSISRIDTDLFTPTFIERDIPTKSGQVRKSRNMSRWKQ